MSRLQIFRGALIAAFGLTVVSAFFGLPAQAQLAPNDANYNPPSYANAHRWGADFCRSVGQMPGLGDMVWVTALDGSTNMTVSHNATSVPVLVHAAGRYCNGWYSSSASGQYSSTNRRIGGTIGYPNTGGGNNFTAPPQRAILDINNIGTGTLRLEMYVRTLTFGPPLPSYESPNAISQLRITRLAPPNQWSVRGESYVNNITRSSGRQQGDPATTARPGDVLHWTHDLRNNGPNNMERDVDYLIGRTGFSGATNSNREPSGSRRGATGVLFVQLNNPTTQNGLRYQVRDADLGRNLCQRISWQDNAWNDPAWGRSDYACVNIPFDYNLWPRTNTSESRSIKKGVNQLRVSSSVMNFGGTRTQDQTRTMLTRFVLKEGDDDITGYQFRQEPADDAGCRYIRSLRSGAQCDQLRTNNGNDRQMFAAGADTPITGANPSYLDTSIEGLNLQFNDRLCYMTSVDRYNTANNQNGSWHHGAPLCFTVKLSPNAQVHGGDTYVGRSVMGSVGDTSATITTQRSRSEADGSIGSWMEFGAFAPNAITSASGAGLAGRQGSSNDITSSNQLTFSNTTQGRYGYFSTNSMGSAPNIISNFSSTTQIGGTSVDINGTGAGNYRLTGSVVRLTNGENMNASRVLYAPNSTVIIENNLTYEDREYSSFAELPQLVIVAENIIINESVSTIDAWLMASDRVVTCRPGSQSASTYPASYLLGVNGTNCRDQLKINGPVMAGQLHLYRVGPVDENYANIPAEVINLRPDAYLWAYGQSRNLNQGAAIKTTTITELPPRF